MSAAERSPLDALVEQGEQAFAEGDLARAETLFRRVLRADGSHGLALNDLAVLLHMRGETAESETQFLKAALFSEDPSGPLVNLAAIAQDAGRLGEAARYVERAFEVAGDAPEVMAQAQRLTAALEALQSPSTVSYRAAHLAVDITPDLTAGEVTLQGYFSPARVPTEVESPLTLQMLLLEDSLGTRALFVAADIFGFGPEMVTVVRAAASEWGIAQDRVVLNASHTHYGPGTIAHAVPGLGGFDRDYAQAICARIADAIPRLYQALQPCTLSVGAAQAQIGFHRRAVRDGEVQMRPNPEGPYDRVTPLLVVDFADAGQRLVLASHGCHPTGHGGASILSADYPGHMRRALMDAGAAHAVMFLQGAAGDVKQATRFTTPEGTRARWTHEPAGVEANGRALAEAIAEALAGPLTPVEGPIGGATAELVFPVQEGPQGLAALDDPRHAGVHRQLLELWSQAASDRYKQTIGGYAIDVQVLTVGQARFVCIPGEPMAETAAALHGEADHTFVLGYTNGLAAYLPTDAMVREGGYEGHHSAFVYVLPGPLDVGTERVLLDGVRALTPQARASAPARAPSVLHDQHAAFFVMSTGRSGTQTLAHLFELADNAKVWHHPEPNLIHETLLAYRGEIDTRRTFWAGRGGLIRQAWDVGVIHGETDHNMTPFADVIAEDIPDARFLILVRDPREFVRSGMRRGYYHPSAGGPWEAARLRPRDDAPEWAAWDARDRLSKVSWLWAETYRHVERLRAGIGEARVHVLRFEDLIAGPEATRGLFEFLGLGGYDEARVRAILGQKLNAQKHGEFPHPRDWTSDMHAACWREVGDLATRYGYPQAYGR